MIRPGDIHVERVMFGTVSAMYDSTYDSLLGDETRVNGTSWFIVGVIPDTGIRGSPASPAFLVLSTEAIGWTLFESQW